MKTLLLSVFMFLSTVTINYSQTFDYGVTYSFLNVSGSRLGDAFGSIADTVINGVAYDTTHVYRSSSGLIGVFIRGNFTVVKMSKEAIINFQPMVDIALGPETVVFSAPVCITLKYGTDATERAESKTGYGIGMGLKFFGVAAEDTWSTHATPILYAELNRSFNFESLWKISLTYNLKKSFYKQFEVNPDNVYNGDVTIKQDFMIFVGYTFNY